MNVILLGPPGVGKGTQSTLLRDKFNLLHISTGDALRKEKSLGTPLGKEVGVIMESGGLVSDDIVIRIVINSIAAIGDKSGFMLDGFPRNIAQAALLETALSAKSVSIDHVISLEADKEVVIKRLAGRRSCSKCGKDYNINFNPPKVAGECDTCDGAKLTVRADDTEETHLRRLTEYEEKTEPLKAYYSAKGLLRPVDGMGAVDAVFREITELLG
jgi:adenylate kinase